VLPRARRRDKRAATEPGPERLVAAGDDGGARPHGDRGAATAGVVWAGHGQPDVVVLEQVDAEEGEPAGPRPTRRGPAAQRHVERVEGLAARWGGCPAAQDVALVVVAEGERRSAARAVGGERVAAGTAADARGPVDGDGVGAGTGVDAAAGPGREPVVAVAAEEDVGGGVVGGGRRSQPGAAREIVVAVQAGEPIVPGAAHERVRGVGAGQHVGARAAEEALDVGADRVALAGLAVAGGADRGGDAHASARVGDAVVAGAAVHGVGAGAAVERVGAVAAGQHVVAEATAETGAAGTGEGQRVVSRAAVDRDLHDARHGDRIVAVVGGDPGLNRRGGAPAWRGAAHAAVEADATAVAGLWRRARVGDRDRRARHRHRQRIALAGRRGDVQVELLVAGALVAVVEAGGRGDRGGAGGRGGDADDGQ
jgi:hypothetical protein